MTPEISVVLEWENQLLAGADRGVRVLEVLLEQAASLQTGLEVIAVFNGEEVSEVELRRVLERHQTPENVTWRLVSSNSHYYELKNQGAKEAAGDIVIFLDCDVIPQDGWLRAMVEPFREFPEIEVLTGNSYITTRSLYAKSFALAWFFPLRSSKAELQPLKRRFLANNLAFRRATRERFPFPSLPSGIRRGACILLGQQLAAEGVQVWIHTGAQVEHPPPKGFVHFYRRAMAGGRDYIHRLRLAEAPVATGFLTGVTRLTYKRLRRIVKKRRRVGLLAAQVPAAWGIMGTFHILFLLGGVVTLAFPRIAERHWEI